MELGNIVTALGGIGLTVIGFLIKHSIDKAERQRAEDARRQEEARAEATKRFDSIQNDLREVLSSLSDQRADLRVAEEKVRALDAAAQVTEARMKKMEEELLLSRQRHHDMVNQFAALKARAEAREYLATKKAATEGPEHP